MATITGYAAVFYNGTAQTEYQIGRNTFERIREDAFNAAIRNDDVVGLFNHDQDNVLGRTSAGTMRLSIDQRGLKYEIDPADTELHKRVAVAQQRGDVPGSSFGFVVLDEGEFADDGRRIREIRNVQLFDVGPVTYPAYQGTNKGDRCVRSTTAAAAAFEYADITAGAEFRSSVLEREKRFAEEYEFVAKVEQQRIKMLRMKTWN